MAKRVASPGEAAAAALHQVEMSSRFLRALGLIVALATLASVVAFGLISLVQQNDARVRSQRELVAIKTILQGVQSATDPNSAFSKANAQRSQEAVTHLIACLENHEDRLTAEIDHQTPPPLLAGCPPESAFTPTATTAPAPPSAQIAPAAAAVHGASPLVTAPATPLPVRSAPATAVAPAATPRTGSPPPPPAKPGAGHGRGHGPKR